MSGLVAAKQRIKSILSSVKMQITKNDGTETAIENVLDHYSSFKRVEEVLNGILKTKRNQPPVSEAYRNAIENAIKDIQYLWNVQELVKLKPELERFQDDLYSKNCSNEIETILQNILNDPYGGHEPRKTITKKLQDSGYNCPKKAEDQQTKQESSQSPTPKQKQTRPGPRLTRKPKSTGITMENAMAQSQLKQIIRSGYQEYVLHYIRKNDLTFVDVKTPADANTGFHCLLDPTKLKVPKNKEELNLDFLAVVKYMEQHPSLMIPCRIRPSYETTKFQNDKWMIIPDKQPQYAIVILWTDQKIKELLRDEDKEEVEDFVDNAYKFFKRTGFKAYDFTTTDILDQIKSDFIDPVEEAMKSDCDYTPIALSSLPPRMLSDTYAAIFTVADTYHDFGCVVIGRNYVQKAISKNPIFSEAISTYIEKCGSDAKFIDYMEKQEPLYQSGKPAIFHSNKHDDFRNNVCSTSMASVQHSTKEEQQTLIDLIAHTHHTRIFVNRGASTHTFDKGLQGLCAASRFEGTRVGVYIPSDSKYGFDHSELMYFDKVVVDNGDIYVSKGTNTFKIPFTNDCIPNKSEKDKKRWLESCLCKFDESDDDLIALAFFDMKRIADGLVIKAALRHGGVIYSHDKIAVIGARLYGCPTILSERGEMISYPPGVKYDPDMKMMNKDRKLLSEDSPIASVHSEDMPAASEQMDTPVVSDLANNIRVAQASSAIMEELQNNSIEVEDSIEIEQILPVQNKKRGRSDSMSASQENVVPESALQENIVPVQQKLSPPRKRFRVRAPEPPSLQKIEQWKQRFVANAYEETLLLNADMDDTYGLIGGGAPMISVKNPSKFLMDCLTELLVLKTTAKNNTSKRDYFMDVLYKTISREDVPLQFVDAAATKRIEQTAFEYIRRVYAKRFGIVTSADYAYKVYTDPHLSRGYNIDYSYYKKLKQFVNRIPAAPKRIVKAPSLKSIRSFDAVSSKKQSVRSAPVKGTTRISVPPKVLSADDARSKRTPITKQKPVLITHVQPASEHPNPKTSPLPLARQSKLRASAAK